VSTATDDQAQLAWEARAGRFAAAAAFGAALLPLIGNLLLGLSLAQDAEGSASLVLGADENAGLVIASGVVNALGALLLAVPLVYLLRAAGARRSETPSVIGPLAIGASALAAAAIVLDAVLLADLAAGFGGAADRSADAATELVTGSAYGTVFQVRLGLAGVLGVVVLLTSLNAMRAGLLSRFMGVMGIAVGVFYVASLFPLGVSPVLIQLFWLVALGLLLTNRWPGGRGPAWERRIADQSAAEADREDGEREGEPERPRPASRKRKRRAR
jgi:hypothetical protein